MIVAEIDENEFFAQFIKLFWELKHESYIVESHLFETLLG